MKKSYNLKKNGSEYDLLRNGSKQNVLCGSGLRKYFSVPAKAKGITVRLHDKVQDGSIQVTVHPYQTLFIVTNETYDNGDFVKINEMTYSTAEKLIRKFASKAKVRTVFVTVEYEVEE